MYYQQNLRPESQPLPDSTSTALTTKLRSVRAKLADPSLSLVPVGGGAGAFGKGQMVMKARNAGEAKWAKKLGRSHLDQRKKEAPRQLVSMRGGNNQVSSTISSVFAGESGMLIIFPYAIRLPQKHYRDMLCESTSLSKLSHADQADLGCRFFAQQCNDREIIYPGTVAFHLLTVMTILYFTRGLSRPCMCYSTFPEVNPVNEMSCALPY